MPPRLPLSTLPLAQFVPVSSTNTSPAKPTPLRRSAHSMSLLPSPFLPSTTPRAPTTTGPLRTLYERGGGGGLASPVSRSRTRSRTPSSRLIDQEELQEQLPGDETATSTPPKRLLDLFVQSVEKDIGSPSKSSDRVSLARTEDAVQETPPAWDFYFDDSVDQNPASPSISADLPEPSADSNDTSVGADPGQDDATADAPFKENVRLPPRRFRSSTSTSLLSIPAESVSAPASLPGSTNPSPTRSPIPTPLTLPTPAPSSSTRIGSPKTPDHVPHSPTYPTSYPPLNADTEVELGYINGFSEGGIGSFETRQEEEPLNGLGLGMEIGETETRKGKKRTSDEHGGLDREGGHEKRLKVENERE